MLANTLVRNWRILFSHSVTARMPLQLFELGQNCYTSKTQTQRLTAFFSRTTWVSWHQKGKPFWILLKQEMMGWQWHQLDHMQIICYTCKYVWNNWGKLLALIFHGLLTLHRVSKKVARCTLVHIFAKY